MNRFVENQYYSMGKTVAGFQSAATTAFLGVGASVATLAFRTAAADQEYRLFALRMYTSLPVARQLKIALDELGQPLENVMWDPELARRFHQLVEDQRVLTQELGPDFEQQMMKIRDVRFEFNRFGVELKYLTMEVVRLLAKTLGTDVDGLLRKLREFNTWFIANMPGIAQWIVRHLSPALTDIRKIAAETWTVIKDLAIVFTNLIATLSGDKGLETSTVNFEKFSTAVQKAVHWVANLLLIVDKLVEALLHVGNAIAMSGLLDPKRLGLPKFGADVRNELKKALGDIAETVPLTRENMGLPKDTTVPVGAPLTSAGPGLATRANVQAAIIETANRMGVSPELALAVAEKESNYQQFDRNGNVIVNRGKRGESHATGIFQLQPGTAKQYGVDQNDVGGNITGGVSYLRDLLQRYGNQQTALEHYYGSKNLSENQHYAKQVRDIESNLHIGSVTVNVPKAGASADDVHKAVRKALEDTAKDRTKRNITEFALPGYSYP